MWGAAALGSALPPLRQPSSDPAEPSFVSSGGGGGGKAESQGSGLRRVAVADDGLGGARGETPGGRTGSRSERGRPRLWSASAGPARRPASPVAAAGALRGSGSPAPALGSVWRWEGGREGERKDLPS